MLNGRAEAYIDAAISGEVARLAAAAVGDRNRTLFKATAALAGLGLREGQILHHLKPAAQSIGLGGKEFYATVKSGVRAGHANPRTLPATSSMPRSKPPRTSQVQSGLPPRSAIDGDGRRPAFFTGADGGPRTTPDQARRHVYRSGEKPVRIKIKFKDGRYANWYRVSDGACNGWQAGKPDGYEPCPYVGELDPFDPELDGDVLYWPEGEKDCDTLGRLALPAFTFGGTGDGLPSDAVKYVRGRELVILADNDPAGREHALRKAILARSDAKSIRVICFEELGSGADVTDYLENHSVADLHARIASTPLWTPPEPPPPAVSDGAGARALLTCNLSDVAPEKVEWLWPGRVAIGKLTVIAGEPGMGKSQLSIWIAAAVTTSDLWPDCDHHAPRGRIVILSAEDGVADTIRPRFDAAGGDASKVTVIRSVERKDTGTRHSFDLAADLKLLEEQIIRLGDVRLVLIDPVSSYMGKVDSHKNADVRSVLEPLAEMAERLRVAVLAISHLSKSEGKVINRVVGSIAFVATARTVFAVVADPEDEEGHRKLLLQVKNNIAQPQQGLAFRLIQREVLPGVLGSAIYWDTTSPVTLTADQAMRGVSESDAGTATGEAVELLADLLASGPVDVLDIEAEARAAAMLSETKRLSDSKPFRAAAKRLGVIRKRIGYGSGGRMQWGLPEKSTGAPETRS